LSSDAVSGTPEVHANGEHLRGQWHDDAETVAVFKGVPFAAPPVGDLRWRAPRLHTPRSGPQQATEFAPGCMQGPHIVDWYANVAVEFGAGPGATGKPNGVSEDCLYLNVWTPKGALDDGATKIPVMVWFHGGSNKGGWSYEPNYIGAELTKKGVVVVSIAYRLGPFGFFSHPGLSQSQPDEAIANFGLLDQMAALEWVRAHIESFGGGSDRVTCFGESSGAGDLGSIFVADSELCRRWIAQSPGGSYAERQTLATEQARGIEIAAQLGIDNEAGSIGKLRAVRAEELLAAADVALPGHYYDVVKDDRTVLLAPLESLDRERQTRIDFLLGTNRDEWYMYISEDSGQEDVDEWLANVAPESASVSGARSPANRARDAMRDTAGCGAGFRDRRACLGVLLHPATRRTRRGKTGCVPWHRNSLRLRHPR
jgi:para-nitrobenzyl esterase